MIELRITKRCKGYNPKSKYLTFDNQTKAFRSVKDAENWLKEEYGNCKKIKMYVEDVNDKTKTRCIGYVYGFRNSDISHLPVEKWLQQDWVEFRESNLLYFN